MQKNKVTAIKTDNGYLVSVPYPMSLEQNGKQFSGRIFLESISDIYLVVKKPAPILHYKKQDETLIPKEEFESARSKINVYWDDEDSEYRFPDLDTEYQLKKAFEPYMNCIPVYGEPEVVRTPVEVKIVGYCIDTGSAFITSSVSLTETANVPFTVNVAGIVYDVLVGKDKVVKSSSNSLDYIKIDGVYLCSSGLQNVLPTQNGRFVNEVYKKDLESAKEFEHFVRKVVNNTYKQIVNKEEVPAVMIHEVRAKLDKTIDEVCSLNVKVKSELDRDYIVSDLRKLVSKLVDIE